VPVADHVAPARSTVGACGILLDGSYRFGKQPVVSGVRPQFVSAKGTAQMATVSSLPPTGGFHCTVAPARPGRILLRACGQLDLATAAEFARELTAWLGRGPAVLIEASEIDFIDCAGLRVLIRARELDPTVSLVNPSVSVLRLLALVGLDFPILGGADPGGSAPGGAAGRWPPPAPGAPGPD
jgi:anti-sigma B factor antagonist